MKVKEETLIKILIICELIGYIIISIGLIMILILLISM